MVRNGTGAPRSTAVATAAPAGSASSRELAIAIKTLPPPPPLPDPRDPFVAQVQARAATVAALVAAFNAHDAKAMADLFDPGCVVLSPGRGTFAPETGRPAIVVGHEALFASQPDVKNATLRLLVAGDYAVQEWVTNGTKADGKKVGFRAATVYRFAGEKVARDATYFDLFTPEVQSGQRTGEARPIPPLPETPVVVAADGAARDAAAVVALKKIHAALDETRFADLVMLFDEDATGTTLFAGQDVTGRNAVAYELLRLQMQLPHGERLPRVEVTRAWGNADLAMAEVVLHGTAKKGRLEPQFHLLHVIERAGGLVRKSTLYGNRLELEDE